MKQIKIEVIFMCHTYIFVAQTRKLDLHWAQKTIVAPVEEDLLENLGKNM